MSPTLRGMETRKFIRTLARLQLHFSLFEICDEVFDRFAYPALCSSYGSERLHAIQCDLEERIGAL